MVSPQFSYARISLSAAAYREGDITLEGKKHHVVLLDFNSNGRFDDQIEIQKNIHTPDGRVYPRQGDMLLIDPNPNNPGYDLPYDVTTSDCRHHVSKLIAIDGRFYDLKISPAGDKLTLTPAALPLGKRDQPQRRPPRGDLRRVGVPQDSRRARASRLPCPPAGGICSPTPSIARASRSPTPRRSRRSRRRSRG